MDIKIIFFLLVSCFLFSCSEKSSLVCYSFDERQCLTDPWVSANPTSLSSDIVSYLNDQEIEIENIHIDPAYHEVACLACEVCPSGPRIYIQVRASLQATTERLPLLSLMQANCSNIF